MRINKQERFRQLATFANVVKNPQELHGVWKQDCFANEHPITLELGCGKGEYTLELAQRNPERNYIGIDLKGARLWVAARRALALGLTNVRFIRMNIEVINTVFTAGEVDEIWIPFPDPFSKKPNRRLISPRYLGYYRDIVHTSAIIHFKTDDDGLFHNSLQTLEEEKCPIHQVIADIYKEPETSEILKIKTTFELKHLASEKKIKYISFSLGNG
ncbi:MAG TPA: tRNA (guanosine(46)-N7)-methyltransferase TrmB [bacterium]|nr:tRNA (guanosine(46)-N7)-methyltransferase TrmB [bacterium]HPN44111.1 tRNA (guanosine(46)-N7)-methyltransferase TrmB [bacterium]